MASDTRGEGPRKGLIARCHANTVEDYRAFARGSEGGSIEEGPGFAFISTAARDSMGNPAFVTVPPKDPAALVQRAAAFFAAHRVPWILIAFPEAADAMTPPAASAGLQDEGEFPGMVLDPIPDLVPPPPEGFRVERATTPEELEVIERTGAKAYGMPYSAPDDRWLDSPQLHLYLGRYRGEPVSLGALIVAARRRGGRLHRYGREFPAKGVRGSSRLADRFRWTQSRMRCRLSVGHPHGADRLREDGIPPTPGVPHLELSGGPSPKGDPPRVRDRFR